MKKTLLFASSLLVAVSSFGQVNEVSANSAIARVSADANSVRYSNDTEYVKPANVSTRADENVNASYKMPQNIYYQGSVLKEVSTGSWSLSGGGNYNDNVSILIIPPCVELTYRNSTPKNTGDTYSWLAKNSGGYTVIGTDYDYTEYHMTNKYGYYYYPYELSVNGGTQFCPPVYIHRKNKDYTEYSDGSSASSGFAPTPAFFTSPTTGNTEQVEVINWSSADFSNETAREYWKTKATGITDGEPISQCRWFPKPVMPFILESTNSYLVVEAKKGAQFKVKLNKLTETGNIGDLIASTTYTFENDYPLSFFSENIELTAKDEFDMDTPVLIDYPFLISYEPLNPTTDFTTFRIGLDLYPEDYFDELNADLSRAGYCWVEIYSPSLKKTTWSGTAPGFYMDDTRTSVGYCSNFHITVNGYYPFIGMTGYKATINSINEPEERDWLSKDQTFEVANSGTTLEITLVTDSNADEMTIGNKDDDELADWVKASAKDAVSEETGDDVVVLNVTVSSLPSNTKYRTETIKLSYFGVEYYITLKQGEDDGVNSVTVEDVTVKAVNGNFEVVVPASVSNVAVYNVAGQVVANVPVTAGVNTIDGSALANGVYVLKFNNGYTVKAVK